jgi:arginase
MNHIRSIKKVKVLGYPFAGGQRRSGVELTPSWLQNQEWFKKLANSSTSVPIEYEEIAVSSGESNQYHVDLAKARGIEMTAAEKQDARNIHNVIKSSQQLRNQTFKALKEGYYPIVLGGDHSQAIGSIAGMKRLFPDAKLIWVDAHIDANTPSSSPSGNAHGMPLAYLSGMVPRHQHWKCVDMEKDLCYFGIRSFEEEEEQLIRDKGVLVVEPKECQVEALPTIHKQMNAHFNHNKNSKYWISFDIDSVDSAEFKSTGTAEGNGLSLDFTYKFFERFTPRTVGMDLTEVNFELTQGHERQQDEQTFRELFEFICD